MRYKIFLISMLAALMVAGCAKAGMPSGGPKDETPPKVLNTKPKNGSTGWTAREFMILFDEYVVVKDADKNILVSPPMNTKPEYGTKGHAVVVKIKDTLHDNTTYLFQFKEGIADFNEGNLLTSYEYVFSTGSSIDSMTIRGQVLDALTHKPYQSDGVITVVAFGTDQMHRFDSVQNVYLDSLLKADTSGALTGKIDKTRLADSIVAKEKPLYMTHCDKEGNFAMNHLRKGYYKVLAFEDNDNNLLLKTGEAVAFLDTLVLADHMPPASVFQADSAEVDSTGEGQAAEQDSTRGRILRDSLARRVVDTSATSVDSTRNLVFEAPKPNAILYISLHKEEVQRLAKVEFKNRGQIVLATVLPLTEHYLLRPLDSTGAQAIYIKANAKRDTLNIWIADKNCDSITLLLTDKDLRDTLNLVYRAPQNIASGAKIPSKTKSKETGLLKGLVASKHPYYDTLWIGFERPVRSIAYGVPDSIVTVYDQTDSTVSYCGVKWVDTSGRGAVHYRAMIDFKGKPGGKYKFTVPAKSFYDVYGAMHRDSLTFSTEYTKVEEYGNIVMTIDSLRVGTRGAYGMATRGRVVSDSMGQDGCGELNSGEDSRATESLDNGVAPVLIQLLNEKGDVLRQKAVRGPAKVSFDHLKGGKYALRAVVDSDGNGIWTAGDYWKHRQPEEVIYFGKILELRENWDMEEHWTVASGVATAAQSGAEDKMNQ